MTSADRPPVAPVDAAQLLAGAPPLPSIPSARVAPALGDARRLVVLDDDPTGTQSVADVPIITAWEPDDVRWALRQDVPGFYVLTNTRSLAPEQAAQRTREVLAAVLTVAEQEGIEVAIVSRSDSTLRGHFPLETDVVADQLAARGTQVDGIALIPAYLEAGRITVDSTHWVRTEAGFIPAADSEFARDPEFGYSASYLPDYVAEKSSGRWRAADVARLTLAELRAVGSSAAACLDALRDRRPLVVDAAAPEDLRAFTLAALQAERGGRTFVYRTGPSFVRDRLGQDVHPPLGDDALRGLCEAMGPGHSRARGGLVVAGSYVGLTSRQLEQLTRAERPLTLTLEVEEALDPQRCAATVDALARECAQGLGEGTVVVATSRTRVTEHDGRSSRAVQAAVSDALVELVRRIVGLAAPRWIVAKGGITSSDIATRALGIRHAWTRGTLLPGIVSLWEPAGDRAERIPYVVFAGNVGGDDALATVVGRLRSAG